MREVVTTDESKLSKSDVDFDAANQRLFDDCYGVPDSMRPKSCGVANSGVREREEGTQEVHASLWTLWRQRDMRRNGDSNHHEPMSKDEFDNTAKQLSEQLADKGVLESKHVQILENASDSGDIDKLVTVVNDSLRLQGSKRRLSISYLK